ncbi:unnamed protein product [Urochloa decumbens]|uniref:Uncharacterized protein n=1 Tax=Urochloa decumbens TaxID=240449 RepID=A0ABC8Z975_9POAL
MGSAPVDMAGLVAGAPSGSLWVIGVLVADAAAGRGMPVAEEVADGKVRRLVGEAEAGEVGMAVRVLHRIGGIRKR